MKGSTQQLRVFRQTSEGHENKAEVAHILEEDEIKQIYRTGVRRTLSTKQRKMKLQKRGRR